MILTLQRGVNALFRQISCEATAFVPIKTNRDIEA